LKLRPRRHHRDRLDDLWISVLFGWTEYALQVFFTVKSDEPLVMMNFTIRKIYDGLTKDRKALFRDMVAKPFYRV